MKHYAQNSVLKNKFAIALFATLMLNALGASATMRESAKEAAKISTSERATGAVTPEEKLKLRMNAVNRALEQSLSERAKSEREFEKNASIGRPRESWMMRKQQRTDQANERMAAHFNRESHDARTRSRADERNVREESQRQRRLNWLND